VFLILLINSEIFLKLQRSIIRKSGKTETMTRPKILHIITRLDPGGSAENTVLTAERVAPDRFDSFVLTGLGLKGSGVPEEFANRLGERLLIEPLLVRPIQPLKDIRALIVLTLWCRRLKPAILHLHSAKAGALGRVAAKWAGIRAKVVYTPHGHVFSGYGSSGANQIFTWIEKHLARWTEAIICLTRDEMEAFLARNAGKPEQFYVIPSGVELQKYRSNLEVRQKLRQQYGLSEDTPVVGFIGRLTEVKGPDYFLDIAAIIHQKNPKTRFLIVGDGELKTQLHHQARRLQIEKALIWAGWHQNVAPFFNALDLLAVTSRNEGQGRVAVEAMAAELPVVTMDSGGIIHVVEDQKTGIVTELGNIQETAEAILKLLRDPAKRQRMGVAGYQRVQKDFSLEIMIERLEKLYLSIVKT